MAYKSLIDYYGGGMVKPSDGYQLGGLVAGARRQRDYSGEMRGLKGLAEGAAKASKKLGGGFLRKLLLGSIGTAIAGPAGAAAVLAGDQALRERRHKKTDFSGGKYAQDIRGDMNKRESQLKDQGLARIGIAGVEGFLGGKSGGMFDKAASGVKGGIGQLRDIRGFLGEGGTMRDVLGGYAQKIGESGVFGDTGITRGLLGISDKAMAATPTVAPAQAIAPEKGSYESYKNIFSKRGQDVPLSREQYLESSEKLKALQQPTPDWAGIEQDRLAAVQSASDAYDKRKEQYDWLKGRGVIEEPEMAEGIYQLPAVNVEGVRPDPSSNVPAEGGFPAGEPLTQSSINELYPEWSTQASEEVPMPYSTYGLISGQYGQPYGFGQPQMQTAGGFGDYKGGGLIEGLMPRGYQKGGQVGYGTATNPQDALRQMGMGEVADDPRLEKYLEDLPQFGMGYKQQLGDITAGARTGLLNIGKEGRLTGARTGFAGGGGWMNPEARQQVQRQFGTQRRGLVEGYQADLLSAIADIEAKGGFEFGGTTGGADTRAGGVFDDAPISDENWNPPMSPTEGATYNFMGDEYIFTGGNWVTQESYQGQGE